MTEKDLKHYQELDDLPQSLRQELPESAQDLYLARYKRTWEKCHMGGITDENELAATAHEAAMLAVQNEFDKGEDGRWQQAPVGSEIDTDKLKGRAPDDD